MNGQSLRNLMTRQKKDGTSIEHFSTGTSFPIDTLMHEIKPVVQEILELD